MGKVAFNPPLPQKDNDLKHEKDLCTFLTFWTKVQEVFYKKI